MERIRVIDSHTAGEPTRVIVAGGPELGSGSLADRRDRMRRTWDRYRRALVSEPRGSEVIVGALLCEPTSGPHAGGVIFFNNVGYLGMCGHGTMGVAVTLAHLGRIGPGTHSLETPVGAVAFELRDRHTVTIQNIPSYRHAAAVSLDVPGLGRVTGDIAWGGNWFFLIHEPPVPLVAANIGRLTEAAARVRRVLAEEGMAGAGGQEIDHIEFLEPDPEDGVDVRNFVLCPGGMYDRSPCGTGTSATLACLAADGRLAPGAPYVLRSIIGSRFEATYRRDGQDRCVPIVTGRAFITGEADLVFDPDDPFRLGVPS